MCLFYLYIYIFHWCVYCPPLSIKVDINLGLSVRPSVCPSFCLSVQWCPVDIFFESSYFTQRFFMILGRVIILILVHLALEESAIIHVYIPTNLNPLTNTKIEQAKLWKKCQCPLYAKKLTFDKIKGRKIIITIEPCIYHFHTCTYILKYTWFRLNSVNFLDLFFMIIEWCLILLTSFTDTVWFLRIVEFKVEYFTLNIQACIYVYLQIFNTCICMLLCVVGFAKKQKSKIL